MILGESSGYEITRSLNNNDFANNIWLIQGLSGCGKSTLCKNLIKGAIQDNVTAIVIDYSGSYRKKDLPYINDNNYHIIELEGLGIDIFKPQNVRIENHVMREDQNRKADRICELLCDTLSITGSSQQGLLHTTVKDELSGANPSLTGIFDTISSLPLPAAKTLASKIRILSELKFTHPLIDWTSVLSSGQAIVFQFSDIYEPKRTLQIEMLLTDLWQHVKSTANHRNFLLVLDEVQNMRFRGNCFLSHLRECRKYGMGVVMATQFLGSKFDKNDAKNLLNQAATKVYFKPDQRNLKNFAQSIDECNDTKWIKILQSLQVGECVYSGMSDQSKSAQNFILRIPFDVN